VLRADTPSAALVILSGALLNRDLWIEKAKSKKGIPFFQSHGVVDTVIGINQARDLEKVLTAAGLTGQLQEFDGGHEIPQEVIFELNRFLKKVYSKIEQPGH
jgi:phospholipase/carboxylesterase